MPSLAPRRPIAGRPLQIVLGTVGVIVVLGATIFAYSLANTYNSSRHTFGNALPAAASRPPATTGSTST